MPNPSAWALFCLVGLGTACSRPAPVTRATVPAGASMDLRSRQVSNPAAYIPPMCWTKTVDDGGRVHNPCYTCHTEPREPNYRDDRDLQVTYSFPEPARENPWTNLFQDRSEAVAAQSDADIRAYVRQGNYRDARGVILPAEALRHLPRGWDFNGNGVWDGYTPDAHFTFDGEGFDRRPDGTFSGWRAFAYDPFPGTFWPTNGSAGDVLIRLGSAFQRREDGGFDLALYKVNLAILEALILQRDVAIDPTDERALGVDLDQDGSLGSARKVRFGWNPRQGRTMSFVGQARAQQAAGQVHLAAGLFPEGTEFLHSVRYLDEGRGGTVGMAPRMKELRRARKRSWMTYLELQAAAGKEVKEKRDFPDRLRTFVGDVEQGLGNGQGWVYQAFIEDREGALRPQTFEETMACMGCHSGLGTTTDGIFSFARKAGAFQGGWYHWSQKGLKGRPEPRLGDGTGEYARYLAANGAGDELRENAEVRQAFFHADGSLRKDRLKALEADVSALLLPSPERARRLNKAYRALVRTQSFGRGRDATVHAAGNVHRRVAPDQETGIQVPILHRRE